MKLRISSDPRSFADNKFETPLRGERFSAGEFRAFCGSQKKRGEKEELGHKNKQLILATPPKVRPLKG